MPQNEFLWRFLVVGYLFTISIEAPILLFGLSSRHSWKRRLLAGIWLTACTYPIVVLVLPTLFEIYQRPENYTFYLIVAETFAPTAECLLFWAAFDRGVPGSVLETARDMVVVVVANLASFMAGLLMTNRNVWEKLLSW